MTARRRSVGRIVSVAALALAGAFQVVRSAVVEKAVDHRPEIAAQAWMGHPRVQLALSMSEIGASAARGQPASEETVARAMEAARRAPLAVEPFLIKGAVATAAGKASAAEKLFEEARRRDPRSAAARFFLSQHYFASGREVEGLAEASVLARLVPGGSSALVPGLAQYARAPGAVANLRSMFATNPQLGQQVLAQLARDASNADLVVALAGDGVTRGEVADAPAWQAVLLNALVERGDFDRAHAVWRRITGLTVTGEGLFNPQFATMPAPPPFNWALGSGDFGVAEPIAPGGLQILFYGRSDGDFATQYMLLAPGTYELRMSVTREGSADAPTGLAWSLDCQPGARALLQLPLGAGRGVARSVVGRFTVPVGCAAQRLRLRGTAREFAASEQAVISNLGLTRMVP